MALAVFTAFVGLIVAPGAMNPVIAVIAIGAIAIGAGAAGALNMWYDADIDALMSRTSKRPVPSGRVTPGEALTLSALLLAQVRKQIPAGIESDIESLVRLVVAPMAKAAQN